ncbi:MAG TPA: ornithine cyclodeaminase family protein [Alphaproteobacteria bacterium]|nr:ornithine cyclodeaminase family protein [Alphaproteobacteria bacterium]
MRIVDGEALGELLDDRALIEALRAMFAAGCEVPARHHHTIPQPGADATLLLMPAWESAQAAAAGQTAAGKAANGQAADDHTAAGPAGALGVKIVTVYPDNGAKGLPAVMGNYMLLDGATGTPQALLDGQALTARRTAAASALAADYLARGDARVLTMVGTGALAPHLVRAHATVRPIEEVWIWGRTHEKARALAEALNDALEDLSKGRKIIVQATDDLERAVRSADVISCATLSSDPLVAGDWLKPGQHLDLVGGFTPAMRETDDAAIARARVYVDTRAGAMSEAGDIVQPLRSGALREEAIAGDLFELARGQIAGRGAADEITLFKSVGSALEDLAAAKLAMAELARTEPVKPGPAGTGPAA